MMIAIDYWHISPKMACFCKLMAQNWHKNLPLAGLISGVTFIHWISGLIDTYMDTFTKDTLSIKLDFEKQYFAIKLFT